jgi:hypothetical protein
MGTCSARGKIDRAGSPFDKDDVNEELETKLLELWWREASRVDPAVSGPESDTKVSIPNVVQRALDALSNSRFFAGLAERALIFDLKEVRRLCVNRNCGAQRSSGCKRRSTWSICRPTIVPKLAKARVSEPPPAETCSATRWTR